MQTYVTAVDQEVQTVPPLPPAANTLKLVIEGTTPVNPWANVLHCQYTGSAPTGPDCVAIATALYNSWNTQIIPVMPTTGTLERVVVTDLSSDMGAEGEIASSTPGTGSTHEMAGSSAVLISKQVARRYRGGHPRSYIFCGGQDKLADASHWTGIFASDVLANYQAALGSVLGTTYGGTTLSSTEAVVSYIDKFVNPVPPYRRPVPLVLPVLTETVSTRVANQRRRVGR